MMMNLLALGLLITTLSSAALWPSHHHHPDPAALHEGHRLIVVEYERQLPPDQPQPFIQDTKDKFQEAASLLPHVGQGISTPRASHDNDCHVNSVKDKICDAYGNCKDKLSSLFGKGKDKASQLEDAAVDAVNVGKDAAVDQLNQGKAKLSEKATQLEEGARDAVERVEEAAADLSKNLTDIIRRALDVACDAAAYVSAPEALRSLAAAAHLAAVAAAYGASVWVTFVSSHVLARALPRQQFGVVQSRLYPAYFRAVAYGVAVALVAHYVAAAGEVRVQGYNLAAVLGLVLVNMLYFEPKATRVMFERMKMEKEEGRGQDVADVVLETPVAASATTTQTAAFGIGRSSAAAAVDMEAVKSRMVKLSKRLKRLNTYSSFLNILALLGLTWHLVHLGQCLQARC